MVFKGAEGVRCLASTPTFFPVDLEIHGSGFQSQVHFSNHEFPAAPDMFLCPVQQILYAAC